MKQQLSVIRSSVDSPCQLLELSYARCFWWQVYEKDYPPPPLDILHQSVLTVKCNGIVLDGDKFNNGALDHFRFVHSGLEEVIFCEKLGRRGGVCIPSFKAG